jgi:hypothetical protein
MSYLAFKNHMRYCNGKKAGYPLREAARNNLPTSLALPFDRLRTSDRLRDTAIKHPTLGNALG